MTSEEGRIRRSLDAGVEEVSQLLRLLAVMSLLATGKISASGTREFLSESISTLGAREKQAIELFCDEKPLLENLAESLE